MPFDSRDLEQLAARGLSPAEAQRQLRHFAEGFVPARLDRPATVGDGIDVLDAERRAEALGAWREAAEAGRLAKFVPASGAASRMFRLLSAALAEDDDRELQEEVQRVLSRAEDFAFADRWREAMEKAGLPWPPRDRRALEVLLHDEGLGLASWPKGLLEFHRYDDDVTRSAFAEHLHEATRLVADADGNCCVHFTVPATARERIREHLRDQEIEGYEFELSDSVQEHSTDTLAADLEGAPFRDDEGRLVFRAGGHGALLGNLEAFARESGRDVVLLKNIDNVAHETQETEHEDSRRALVGWLLLLRKQARAFYERLKAGADEASLEEAEEFCRTRLYRESPGGDDLEARRRAVLETLDRPTRVCGMVLNEGEPGGGPFWVREADGRCSLQIVESSQIDHDDPEQIAIRDQATHFNPVDLACALRSFETGEVYDLERYVDPATGFLSRKSHAGRELQALERPGLWNGAMAGWNTVFVEVAAETFHPVKTVLDLLRPAHRGI